MAAKVDSSIGVTHVCKHCQVPLEIDFIQPQPPFRVTFPHTIQDARVAAQDGCPIFKELVVAYTQRSLWGLARSHLLSRCKCCKGFLQGLRYVASSLSSRPLHLLFLEHRYDTGPEPLLDSFMHLDCGNGPLKPKYNAYTYTGQYRVCVRHLFAITVS